jgi:hypothetical protein
MFPTCLNMLLSSGMKYSLHEKWLHNRLSIFTQNYIGTSMRPRARDPAKNGKPEGEHELLEPTSDCWSFLRFVDLSPKEVEEVRLYPFFFPAGRKGRGRDKEGRGRNEGTTKEGQRRDKGRRGRDEEGRGNFLLFCEAYSPFKHFFFTCVRVHN